MRRVRDGGGDQSTESDQAQGLAVARRVLVRVRRVVEEAFASLDDVDGNVVEQFQTTGFSNRDALVPRHASPRVIQNPTLFFKSARNASTCAKPCWKTARLIELRSADTSVLSVRFGRPGLPLALALPAFFAVLRAV